MYPIVSTAEIIPNTMYEVIAEIEKIRKK